MKKTNISAVDQQWLKKLGKHVEGIIQKKGYATVYDFWINKAGDGISRASLNNLITGSRDFRLTTVRKVAKLLGVKVHDLFRFED